MRYGDFALRGEFARRAGRNMSRLEDGYFTPEDVFADATLNSGWPGDREGRAMLADTLLEALTGRESAHLKRFYKQLPLNEKGYRGNIILPLADEQQLSGHNWLLRALTEHYAIHNDARSAETAEKMVKGLYLPLLGKYASYPSDPSLRGGGGSYAGNTDGERNGWIVSTDVGCAFMSLDALTRYSEVFASEAVARLTDEMARAFCEIDLVVSKMQTHASLSAARGLARAGRVSEAEKVFDTYTSYGMTAHYANQNWFGRPEWTEPCAIADSVLLAAMLYERTRKFKYAQYFNRFLFTALFSAQRNNGGFGCDSCPGAGEEPEILTRRIDEAYWCCTMRGAEGLSEAARRSVIEEENGLTLLTLIDGKFNTGLCTLEVETAWPENGPTAIEITGVRRPFTLKYYTPAGFASAEIKTDQTLSVVIPAVEAREEVAGASTVRNGYTLWRGDLMLGLKEGASSPEPIANAFEDEKPVKRRVIFHS